MRARPTARLLPAALLTLALCLPAAAGPWQAGTPQGLQVRIVQDSFRARDAYLLERRYPDGTLDATFGQQGVQVFTLGPDNEGPSALRGDAAGRLWVAGASAGQGDTLQAVVLRFLPHGPPDAGWAEQGRSAVQPAGRGARALDLLPLPDGGAWVAGLVTEAGRGERAALWRLRADGQVDPRFGDAGLWRDPDARPAEVMGLEPGADGSVRLLLRHGLAADATAPSAWQVAPGALQPVPMAGAAPAPSAGPAMPGVSTPARAPMPSPFAAPASEGGASRAATRAETAPGGLHAAPLVAACAVLALAFGLWWAWRRRR